MQIVIFGNFYTKPWFIHMEKLSRLEEKSRERNLQPINKFM